MSDENKKDEPKIQADNNSVAIGNISASGNIGDINIGNTGYTSQEVSVLITQIKSTFQPKPFDGRCPYKGLDVFEEEDAELFFGREKLVDDLISRVKDSQTVFVTGPSGSGKSSLVRAGLIPALKQGAIKNSERWLYATMKPGREPIGELGRVAASLAGSTNAEDEIRTKAMTDATIFARWCEIALKEGRDKRVVLFIDQFEEVFTQINNETERVVFLNLLTHAATVESGRVMILFSMRSDFVSNCATYPQLNALLNQRFVQIGAMQPEELVSAIAQPALRVGLRIDPDLIAQIINEMKGEPGALPLMQFALKDLFDSQQEKNSVIALTLNDYLQRGGIHKALERHADTSFAKLDTNEQELARSIFSGLIEIGRGTQDTKRTALFDELVPANTKAEDVEAIVQKLADARLITTDEQAGKDTVAISHEKLIDAWPWLKKLVNENRDVIALQNEIASDAKEWDEHKRDASYLYTAARLLNSLEQLKSNRLVLSGIAYDFIQAGRVRKQRSQLALISGASIFFVLLILTAVVFRSQAQQSVEIANTAQAASTEAVAQKATAQANADEAQHQAKIARAGELAAQSISIRDKNFLLSLLLGVEAFQTTDIPQSRSTLLDNTQISPQLLNFLSGYTSTVTDRWVFSPDGKILASESINNTIILWDVLTGLVIGQPLTGHNGLVTSMVFSLDSKTLASGSHDNIIILWNVATGNSIWQPFKGHTEWVSSVAFSPDGKTLASGGGEGDNTIILWNVATRQPIGQSFTGHLSTVENLVFNSDGKMLASNSWDKTIILWDVATHQPINQLLTVDHNIVGYPLAGGSDIVAFSPDGKILAYDTSDNTIILWDVATRQPIGNPLTGHTDPVTSVAFSPDGTTLASGSYDNTIILWDVTNSRPIGQPLEGHTAWINALVFSPDGKTLTSGAGDKSIILWNVVTGNPVGQPLKHTSYVSSVAFSPDGKTLAFGSDLGITLWDVTTGKPIGQPLTGHTSYVSSVAFSPDGKTLASGGALGDNTIILWNLATSQPIGQPLMGHNSGVFSTSGVFSVAFSPDGKMLASGSYDNTIILWNVETGQPIGQPLKGNADSVENSVVFSSDGKALASNSSDNTIILWDVATRQPIGQPLIGVNGVAFSPDGKILVSGSEDKTIILWNVATGQPIGQPLTGHTASVLSVAFSPDGKTLASGSDDSTIILWDIANHQPIGQPLMGDTDAVTSVAFSPDGKMLARSGRDGIYLWDVATGQLIGQSLRGFGAFETYESSLTFSSDGKMLASRGRGDMILWDVDPQSWVEKTCDRAGRNFTHAEWERYFPNEEYRKTCDQWPLEPKVIATPTTLP